MNPKSLREKTDHELEVMERELTDDLMHFRIQSTTGVVDNVKKARDSRRDIARIKTIQRERRVQAAEGTGERNES